MILKALVEKDPKMTEAMTALANLYLRDLQEPQKALPLYERVLALEPGRASFQVNLGVYYLKSGDRAKAREQFNKAVALDPKLAEAHYNLACLYAVEGKRGEAEQALRRAVEADPRSAQWAKEDPDLALLRTSP
jgi:Tfp pilus assembly protein PilF